MKITLITSILIALAAADLIEKTDIGLQEQANIDACVRACRVRVGTTGSICKSLCVKNLGV